MSKITNDGLTQSGTGCFLAVQWVSRGQLVTYLFYSKPWWKLSLKSTTFVCRDMKKARKEARRMVCICSPPTSEELARGVRGCGEDCLNRMLMIEWYVW